MQPVIVPIIEVLVLVAAQLIVAGGLAAFSILSGMHEDRAFPREGRSRKLLLHMHRGRLHLVLILILIEVLLVALSVLWVPSILWRFFHLPASGFIAGQVLPAIIGLVLLLLSGIAGVGIAAGNPGMAAFLTSYPLFPLYFLLKPLSVFFLKAVALVFPDLPGRMASPLFLLPDSGGGGEGFIENNGSRLVRSIVEFGEKRAREVMVPRIDVFALDYHAGMDEIREKVAGAGHSRVPIYDSSIDRIIGILCVKDLVQCAPDEDGSGLRKFLREAYFVPEGKKIDDLLREFQKEKKHMAIVVDEYGGTSGIVTLEDILEEIVGEIRDEHDQEGPLVRQTGKDLYIVEGRMNLDDLSESLKISLPSDEVDTLGGFLYDLVGHVPEEGEEIGYEGIHFRIERLDGQRIAEVMIRLSARGGDS